MSANSNRICCSFIRAPSGWPNSPFWWYWCCPDLIFTLLSTTRTESPPAPQTCTNGVQHSEPPDEDLDPEADDVDSFEQHVDNLFAASETLKRKRRKTTKFRDVKTIESDGTIKQLHLNVREAMKPPNGRKIVLRFNDRLQPVGNEASILSDVVRMLGFDFTKFLICEKDWRKVRSRDKIYNECVKVNRYIFVQSRNLNSTPTNNLIILLLELFHFEEDSGGIMKCTILKVLGRTWKETRNHLYHYFYKSDLTLEQNIKGRPPGITADHWRWFLDYRNSEETKEKCRKNTENRSKQLYTYTGGSKSLARLGEEEAKERITEIEQHDESSRLLSQNDSLAQTLEKEHPGRVHGMGIGPTTSQVFGTNSPQPSIETQREETQRVLVEIQAELPAEKLKRKAIEDEVAAEKTKRQAMESSPMCLVQGQGGELPPDLAPWMNSLEGHSRE
ncbi:hypothetical protein Ahy_Scaffold2g107643 [Arachis hypogaea]|uniref:Uncharacterized protein n=1 Tax=Arachis hypogaea TaxID=3818 RepID=A0A444WQJ8_ARAHY|nr:hypothetical protein Ahy_Scaffold2g107643 [Arachis hypogaea]